MQTLYDPCHVCFFCVAGIVTQAAWSMYRTLPQAQDWRRTTSTRRETGVPFSPFEADAGGADAADVAEHHGSAANNIEPADGFFVEYVIQVRPCPQVVWNEG